MIAVLLFLHPLQLVLQSTNLDSKFYLLTLEAIIESIIYIITQKNIHILQTL